ncbi:caspase family protein [Phenylobacterium sp.]|uniref:caspase family protein n=1 Tax=Phenylobacterium sp. TaxID=1871053 RepID=UPI0025E8FC79|nr:caspase family protein [Phenylobacterium sp.]
MLAAKFVASALLALILSVLALSPAYAQAQPGRRIALVIGNATYTNGGVLDNPEADADAVAAKLTGLGFQVTSDKNLGQSGMRDLIGGFMSRVRDGDLVLIYYAGHGIEADGRDYMLPVDVKLETPTAVQFQGIPLDMLYSDKQTFGVIVVFDACRDNPFLRRVKGAVAGTHALSPPVGALVLFSASSGDVAEDASVDAGGGASKNSVFAVAFTHALSVPDASIQKIYQSILREVRAQTSNRQAPQRFGDLAEDFTFNATGRPIYAAAAPPPVQAAPAPAPEVARLAAADNTGPPGAVYRSLPVPAAASPAPTPGPTAPTAQAPPAQVTAPPVGPPAAAPQAEAPPAAAPPLQVASVTPSPALSRPPPAAAPPPVEMHFTIASLGENVMPPPPQLEAVPVLTLPAKFCSVEAEIDYLNNVFKPAYTTAYRNNEIAIAYLSALNVLGQEYNGRQSGFVFRIKSQFEAFAPVATRANEASNQILGLDAQIRHIPIEACPKG